MMSSTRLLGNLAVAMMLPCLPAIVAADQPFFMPFDRFSQGEKCALVRAVSANGRVVAGSFARSALGGSAAFVCGIPDRRVVPLGDLPGERDSNRVKAVSADGLVVVGQSSSHYGYEAYRWTAATGIVGLGDIPGGYFRSQATDVSADGSVIVGSGTSAGGTEPFRWTPAGGIESLGFVGQASAVSDDGRVIAGKLGGPGIGPVRAFRWTADGGMAEVTGLSNIHPEALSADGSVLVGWATTSRDSGAAILWSEATGIVELGDLPGCGSGNWAHGVSGDGRIVVGFAFRQAFIWDQERGMRNLGRVLQDDYGLELGDWILTKAQAISADGRTIVGRASTNRAGQGFVAYLGDPNKPAGDNPPVGLEEPAADESSLPEAVPPVEEEVGPVESGGPVEIASRVAGPQDTLTKLKPLSERSRFVAALGKVEKGMSKEEVQKLLGPPDDIITHHDESDLISGDPHEAWCYGSDGHLTMPTLGRVFFDIADKVTYTKGAEGTLPELAPLDETELRRLLRVIDGITRGGYDPLSMIQAVNVLQPLGREKVVFALREHARTRPRSWGRTGRKTRLLIRVLFEVPADPGYMPKMGRRRPPPPEDPWVAPRWPIVIVDDVPLLVASPGFRAGSGFHRKGQIDPHLEFVLEKCELRDRPLTPSVKPLDVLHKIEQSPAWMFGQDQGESPSWGTRHEDGHKRIARQLLSLLSSVYREGLPEYLCPGAERNANTMYVTLEETLADWACLDIRWDAEKNDYTKQDGTRIPKLETYVAHYRAVAWILELPGTDIRLSIQREDRHRVDVLLSWRQDLPSKTGPIEVVLYEGAGQRVQLGSLQIEGSPSHPYFRGPRRLLEDPDVPDRMKDSLRKSLDKMPSLPARRQHSSSQGCKCDLALGKEMQAVLSYAGISVSSPVYKP